MLAGKNLLCVFSLVINLGGQVVLEDAKLVNSVLDNKRLLLMQTQTRLGREGCGLVKHIQVSDGELLLHGVRNFERGSIFTAIAIVGTEPDGSGTSLGLDSELNEISVGRDRQGLVQRVKLLADLGELARVDGDNGAVVSLRDSEVLDVQRDQVHGELSGALGLGILKTELEVRGVVLGAESDGVGGVSELHNLGEERDVDAEHHACVGAVVLEALHGEVERNESDVRAVHCLKADA